MLLSSPAVPLLGPDDHTDDAGWSVPPPLDDRLWRHPSELAELDLGPRPRRRLPGARTFLAGVAGALVTLAVLAVLGQLGGGDEDAAPAVVRQAARPASVPVATSASVVEIAEEVRPAIAKIRVVGRAGATSGSAVLYRDDGHLLTNAHVVAGGGRVEVALADGTTHRAQVVGTDEATDIAVLRIPAAGDGEPYPTAVLGTAAELAVGQPVVAIGSPLGLAGGSSVTTGVVSALGREVEADGTSLLDMVQTDAAISPGSSGGALVDGTGAVIAITTAVGVTEAGVEGVGFATPVDVARSVGEDIIATGRAAHAWIGVQGSDLDRPTAEELGVDGGARVEHVVEASPADAAGVTPSDVIVAIEEEAVASMSALVIALRERAPGDEIALDVVRDGARREVAVSLIERPAQP
jgi:S1-C subfamily serine protease